MLLVARILVAGLVLFGTSAAQEVRARIELESGRVLRVPVLKVDADQLIVGIDGEEMSIPTAEVRSIETLTEVSDAASRDAQLARVRAALAEQSGAAMNPAAVGDARDLDGAAAAAAAAGDAGDAEASTPATRVTRGPDARIVHLFDRYLWLIPAGAGHFTSIGAALLALFTCLVVWCARLASIENVGLGRGFAVAVCLLAVFTVEASLLPATPAFFAAAAVVDLVALFTLSILVLHADVVGAAWMVLCFTLNLLVAVLIVELVGVLVQPDMLTAP